jgi:ATP-dependent protease ClpP protease subunit
MHGVNAYNILLALPFNLTTHNAGNVDSIGNAMFLAGNERIACPHSTFMFHGAGWSAPGTIFDVKATQERLDSLNSDQARISSIITSRSGVTPAMVEGFFQSAKVLTADDALTHGLATSVGDISIPEGAHIAVVNG